MFFRKLSASVLMIGLATGLAFSQDDVLERARAKYDRARAAESAESTQPAPAAESDAAASAAATATVDGDTVKIEVDVKVKVESDDKASAPATVAADDEPAAVSEKPGRSRFLTFQFVPGLPRVNPNDSTVLALSPVFASVGKVKALEFGLFLANANEVHGAQIASLATFNRSLDGIQTAGLFNIGGRVNGIQTAGLFNIAGNGGGFKAAGLFNISGDFKGVETAGLFNIAGDVQGAQVSGLLNVGKKVKGIQAGLVNISEDLDGIAIGLVNYSKNGINEIDAWYESNGMINVGVLSGSRHFYTILQAGELATDYFQNTNSLSAALGLGFRVGSNEGLHAQADLSMRSLLDIDGNASPLAAAASRTSPPLPEGWTPVDGSGYSYTPPCGCSAYNPVVALFPSLRLGVGLNFGKFVGIFAGVTLDIEGGSYWSVPEQFKSPASIMFNVGGDDFGAYAKWYAGIALL